MVATDPDRDGASCYYGSLTLPQRLGGAAYALERYYAARKRHRIAELGLWRAFLRYLGI